MARFSSTLLIEIPECLQLPGQRSLCVLEHLAHALTTLVDLSADLGKAPIAQAVFPDNVALLCGQAILKPLPQEVFLLPDHCILMWRALVAGIGLNLVPKGRGFGSFPAPPFPE